MNNDTHPYQLPGAGDPTNADCGDVTAWWACTTKLPDHYRRPIKVHCDHITCPECYGRVLNKAAQRASDRIRGLIRCVTSMDPTLGQQRASVTLLKRLKIAVKTPRHIIFSPPPEAYQPSVPLDTLWSDAIDQFKGAGLLAGLAWFHPYRIHDGYLEQLMAINRTLRSDGQKGIPYWRHALDDTLDLGDPYAYWTWGPHWHLLAMGRLEDARSYHARTGWTYKNKGHRPEDLVWNEAEQTWEDQLERTARYVVSHAGITQGRQAYRPFGFLHSRYVKKTEQTYEVHTKACTCPKCRAPIHRHWGRDEGPTDADQESDGRPIALVCTRKFYEYTWRTVI